MWSDTYGSTTEARSHRNGGYACPGQTYQGSIETNGYESFEPYPDKPLKDSSGSYKLLTLKVPDTGSAGFVVVGVTCKMVTHRSISALLLQEGFGGKVETPMDKLAMRNLISKVIYDLMEYFPDYDVFKNGAMPTNGSRNGYSTYGDNAKTYSDEALDRLKVLWRGVELVQTWNNAPFPIGIRFEFPKLQGNIAVGRYSTRYDATHPVLMHHIIPPKATSSERKVIQFCEGRTFEDNILDKFPKYQIETLTKGAAKTVFVDNGRKEQGYFVPIDHPLSAYFFRNLSETQEYSGWNGGIQADMAKGHIALTDKDVARIISEIRESTQEDMPIGKLREMGLHIHGICHAPCLIGDRSNSQEYDVGAAEEDTKEVASCFYTKTMCEDRKNCAEQGFSCGVELIIKLEIKIPLEVKIYDDTSEL